MAQTYRSKIDDDLINKLIMSNQRCKISSLSEMVKLMRFDTLYLIGVLVKSLFLAQMNKITWVNFFFFNKCFYLFI